MLNMHLHALSLMRGLAAAPTAAAACATHSQRAALTALAERVWSSMGAQTSYSTSANTGHTGSLHPAHASRSPAPPTLLASTQPRLELALCSRQRAASTFSTAASSAMQQPQHQAPVSQGADAAAFEPGGADQGELIVEESAFKVGYYLAVVVQTRTQAHAHTLTLTCTHAHA